MQFLKCINSA